jgi:hypothetical protein
MILYSYTLLFLGLSLWVPLEAPQPLSQADLTVTIDGKRTPQDIPDWLVWRQSLKLIGTQTVEQRTALAEFIESDLALNESDLGLLRAAARRHLEREAGVQEFKARLATQAPPRTEAEKARHKQTVRAYETEFRLGLLADADRLLDALSFDGRQRVADWVQERKKNMTVTVLKAELDWFRWPR